MVDYYQILGVKKTATDQEIHSAFRRLAKATHPDLNKNDLKKAEQFTQIKQAYDTLSNPDKRQKYDAGLKAPKAPQQPAKPAPASSSRSYKSTYRPLRKRSRLYYLFRYQLFSACVIIGIYIVIKQLFNTRYERLFQIILMYKLAWLLTLFVIIFSRRHFPHRKR